jgi:hypothetical protein
MKLASSPFSIAKTFFNTLPDLHDGYLVRLYDKRNRICDNSLAALRILKNNLTGRYDKALPSKKLTNALRPHRSSGAKKATTIRPPPIPRSATIYAWPRSIVNTTDELRKTTKTKARSRLHIASFSPTTRFMYALERANAPRSLMTIYVDRSSVSMLSRS